MGHWSDNLTNNTVKMESQVVGIRVVVCSYNNVYILTRSSRVWHTCSVILKWTESSYATSYLGLLPLPVAWMGHVYIVGLSLSLSLSLYIYIYIYIRNYIHDNIKLNANWSISTAYCLYHNAVVWSGLSVRQISKRWYKKTRKLLIHVSLSWYPNPMSVSIIQHEMYPPKGE